MRNINDIYSTLEIFVQVFRGQYLEENIHILTLPVLLDVLPYDVTAVSKWSRSLLCSSPPVVTLDQ
jgi:hypothetical protein